MPARLTRVAGAILLLLVPCLGPVSCGGAAGGEDGTRVGSERAGGGRSADGGIAPGGAPGQVTRTTTIRVDGHDVTVEVADTPALRERGLMHRDSLPEDHGMLFVYGESQTLSFWMRNTRFPLDIAFIDAGGTIVDIQQMEPQSDEQHVSAAPALYALEMPLGWFEEHDVEVGDRVEI